MAFGRLPGPVKSLVLALIALAGVAGPLLIAIGGSISTWVALSAVLGNFSALLIPASANLTKAATAMGGLNAAQNAAWASITTGTSRLGTLKAALTGVTAKITGTIGAGLLLADSIDKTGDSLQGFDDHIEEAVSKIGIFRKTYEALKVLVLDLLWEQLKENVSIAFEEVKAFGSWLGSGFMSVLETVKTSIGELGGEVLDHSIEGFKRFGDALSKIFPAIAQAIDILQDDLTETLTGVILGFSNLAEQEKKTAAQTLTLAKEMGIAVDEFESLAEIQKEIGRIQTTNEKHVEEVNKVVEKQAEDVKKLVKEWRKAVKVQEEFGKDAKSVGMNAKELAEQTEEVQIQVHLARIAEERYLKIQEARKKIQENLRKEMQEYEKALKATALEAQNLAIADEALIDAAARFPTQEILFSDDAFSFNPAAGGGLETIGKDILASAAEGVGDIEFSTEKAEKGVINLTEVFRDLDSIINALGIDANSSLGGMLSSLFQLGAAIPIITGQAQSEFQAATGAAEKFSAGVKAAATGVASVIKATSKGSTTRRTLGGAAAGASAGSQFGPIGTIVGAAAGAIVGFIRGKKVEKQFKKIREAIGLKVSDELREGIIEASKKLNISLGDAALLNLGEAIREMGGVSEITFGNMRKSFSSLLQKVRDGSVPMKEGMEAITDSFGEIAAFLETTGTSGQVELGKMINEMREMGLVTEEVKAKIKELATSALGNLSVFLDFLTTQFGKGGTFEGNMEAAAANVGVLVGTFGAAVAAAGSLAGAVGLLPESFGELLVQFRELLGNESKALNKLTQFYNFAVNNEDQLNAIGGLVTAMGELAAAGILNKDTIQDFGGAAILQMQDVLASTQNQSVALLAMAPQIAELLALYNEMGVQVPPSLQDIANKALEAGASLTPPEGIQDILGSIRDVLLSIAGALGVVSSEANNATNSLQNLANQNVPNVPDSLKGDGIPEFATGGVLSANPPFGSIFQAGEREDELIIPESEVEDFVGGKNKGGGGSTSVTVNLPGFAVGTTEELSRMVGDIVLEGLRRNSGGIESEIENIAKRVVE
jgi:hypothetical protein